MNSFKPTASLSPSLLARKGGAKPAMRPQIQPLDEFHESAAREMTQDDLGWNDMGEDEPSPGLGLTAMPPATGAEVVPINGAEFTTTEKPQILHQRENLAAAVSPARIDAVASRPLASAPAKGRRAAFTLRLDAERHLRLRLASTLTDRSAQQIVTEALDQFLAGMPDVEALANNVRKRR